MSSRYLFSSSPGASLSEVLVAMSILPIGLMATLGAFQVADRVIAQGTVASRALAMAESRIEAKRAAQWEHLLEDDLNYDGIPDIVMHDDGQGGDLAAGDGVYSGMEQRDGVLMTWMVTPSKAGNLSGSGYVLLEARASYAIRAGRREVKITAVRANSVFVGQ